MLATLPAAYMGAVLSSSVYEEDSHPYHKELKAVPDDAALGLHRKNCEPQLVAERLDELVPLLKLVGFGVEEMSPGRTTLAVPLLETAMNQNGTQQAAVFYLIADYTLG